MLAFNTFDPYAILAGRTAPAAKPAKDAKVDNAPLTTLAGLATLAGQSAQYHHAPSATIAAWNSHDWQEEFDHRVAIIENDAGIPREWAEAFARVCLMQRPSNLSRHGWQRTVNNTGRLLDNKNHLRDMVRYGWGIPDIFGCHPIASETRQDVKGFLLLLDENEKIISINDKAISLCTRSGSTLYYRRPLNPSSERVMIWELNND